MNLNEMAREITLSEGLKKSVNIAQVKEIMKLLVLKFKTLTTEQLAEVFKKYR